ncbi:AsnC family transcriptional regulator [Sphingomonas oleivorans]|uniref:AsnC family transcriptional regulator n=1 Tax=Sphingomonas oleivorans TaxID=1735121 RepID=A0A2T5FZJ7_9SPHN|nr:Lrp/AsnC family transcriptional regulator [Sphingomonas oleivorans]PTQ12123.1 AsnC family transcriptional regulator [Sphingomonas oleivorans]
MSKELKPEKLDRLDFKILAYLQRHGRVTNVALADAVGLSASPCLSRVKRLEECGYITSYGAHIALEKLGDYLMVFTEITLKDHRVADFNRFMTRARAMPEIIECHHVSGGYDYLLKIVSRSVSHYQELIEGLLESDAGMEKYFSYIVLDSPIVRNGFPIGRLFGQSETLDI